MNIRFCQKRGIVWTGIEKILVQMLALVQSVILARLLMPSDFGLVAMLGIFLGIGGALAESGLGTAYIVYGLGSRRVFLWNIGMGAAIYAILAVSAPFVADFYGVPVLKPLLWVMGIGIVLNATSVLGNARLQRQSRFRTLSLINVATTFFGFVVAIVLAAFGCGVWAIAGMGVASAMFRLVFLAELQTLKFSPGDDRDFRKMLSYGLKLTLSGFIHTAYLNAYNLIVGKMFSPAVVGLFARGQRLAALPTDVVNDSVGRIALPDMAQERRSARSYLILNALILWPLLAVLELFAEELVGFVLGDAWLDCVLYLQILVVGVAFTPLTNISLQYIRARGRGDLVLATDVLKKPVQIGLLVAGGGVLATGICDRGVVLLCWVKVAGDVVEAIADIAVAWWLRRRIEGDYYNTVKLALMPIGNRLRQMHEARDFDKLLEGKTVAVVGNGPSERGKGLGREIDAHDVVIRFNNYRTHGYEDDYGRKTDVWMKGGASDVRYKIPDRKIKAVLYTDDIVDDGLLSRFSRYPEIELKRGLVVDYLDKEERKPLIDALGAMPSSGAFLASRLLRIRNVTVDFYGFAFLEPAATRQMDRFEHYADETDTDQARKMMTIANHDVEAECDWFSTHVDRRRLK